jgi:2-oxo-4-hydroxy-4-carboxy--5-ureidoimidazoline (OHCU) decarboxylase
VTVALGADLAAAFERAPVLAERVAARITPGDGPERALAIAREELAAMSESERIAVLDAHPRIGADLAALSALSRAEQGANGDAATLRELARLNDEYERRFGFRFVVFVRGRTKAEIVPVLRSRLLRAREEELATGIAEFLAIAEDRLAKGRR